MFVAAGDFDYGDFILTDLDKLDSGEFDAFVNYHEEKELRKLLGSLFYDALASGVNALPDGLDLWDKVKTYALNDECVFVVNNVADLYLALSETTGSQPNTNPLIWQKQPIDRWIRLKFGDAFNYQNNPHKWYGMKTLIVPLIYSKWITKTSRKTTVSGTVTTANENSNLVSPNFEIIKGWNEWSRLAGGEFVRGWTFSSSFKETFFFYLYCVSTTFDDLIAATNYPTFKAYLERNFTFPGRMNDFDL